ncbi:MAG: prevent-host-death protein [Chromatiaceae bacterium]
MKELNVREMREAIGRLDTLVEDAGELIVTRRGKPIARILPVTRRVPRPDHAELRARMPHLGIPSEELIRQDRDER